jgi:hypothetical protein
MRRAGLQLVEHRTEVRRKRSGYWEYLDVMGGKPVNEVGWIHNIQIRVTNKTHYNVYYISNNNIG